MVYGYKGAVRGLRGSGSGIGLCSWYYSYQQAYGLNASMSQVQAPKLYGQAHPRTSCTVGCARHLKGPRPETLSLEIRLTPFWLAVRTLLTWLSSLATKKAKYLTFRGGSEISQVGILGP